MKTKRKPKKGVRIVLAATTALALPLFARMCREPVPDVNLETVVRSDLVETVPASGTIRPVVELRISPEVSGEIVSIFAKEGERVRAGERILQIRPDLYQSQVAQAGAALGSLRAQYTRQRAELRQARLDHERNRKLFELDAVSTAEYQRSETELQIAESSLDAAEFAIRSGEAQLKEARDNLQKTSLYAPIDGIVSQLNVEEGERVVGTSQMPGTELLRISDFSRMEVSVEVGENDIVRIRPRDSVRIEIDAYPRREFRGFVTQIANSAKNIDRRFDQVTNFGVRIELVPDSVKFLPGMSAAVNILTERRNGCLAVPVRAVFARERKTFVWVAGPDRTVERRAVVTGIQDRDRIEIREGLSEGETVVTGPPGMIEKELTDGRRVRALP